MRAARRKLGSFPEFRREWLEERVEKSVKKFLKKADIVTTDELKALKKEIRELKESLNKSASTSEN